MFFDDSDLCFMNSIEIIYGGRHLYVNMWKHVKTNICIIIYIKLGIIIIKWIYVKRTLYIRILFMLQNYLQLL